MEIEFVDDTPEMSDLARKVGRRAAFALPVLTASVLTLIFSMSSGEAAVTRLIPLSALSLIVASVLTVIRPADRLLRLRQEHFIARVFDAYGIRLSKGALCELMDYGSLTMEHDGECVTVNYDDHVLTMTTKDGTPLLTLS